MHGKRLFNLKMVIIMMSRFTHPRIKLKALVLALLLFVVLNGCIDSLYLEAIGNCKKERKKQDKCKIVDLSIQHYCHEQRRPDSPYYEADGSKRLPYTFCGLRDTEVCEIKGPCSK